MFLAEVIGCAAAPAEAIFETMKGFEANLILRNNFAIFCQIYIFLKLFNI